ncbi:MAG TPA: hypothetical protein VG387_05465 [Rhizomicrobium sp.]|jgi:hypothetical protein|nr:hypothetical protein [Rhizomicrobium sp.]
MPNHYDLTALPPAGQFTQILLSGGEIHIPDGAAIEVHVRFPNGISGPQSLYTVCGGDAYFAMAVAPDGTGAFKLDLLAFWAGLDAGTASASFPIGNIADGNWHQVAIWAFNGQAYAYIDGAQVLGAAGAPDVQPYKIGFGQIVGTQVLGGYQNTAQIGRFSKTLTGSFSGHMAEVRVWNSGNFVPAPWAPVAPSATGLFNYLPLWTNYPNGTNDVAQGGAPTLNGVTVVYETAPAIYDVWSDALLNVASAPFPAFTDPLSTDAVADIVTQLGSTLLPSSVTSPAPDTTQIAAFRSMYTTAQNDVTTAVQDAILALQPNTAKYTAPGYPEAFAAVQQQLAIEIQVAVKIYGYVNDAQAFANQYYDVIDQSLSDIGNEVYIQSSSGTDPVSAVEGLLSEVDDVAGFIEKALELVAFLAAAKRRTGTTAAGAALGDASLTGAAAMQLYFSTFRFAMQKGQVSYTPGVALTGTLAAIASSFGDYNTGTLLSNLSQNANAVLSDWGKMGALYSVLGDLYFPFVIGGSDEPVYNLLYQAGGDYFGLLVLKSQVMLWTFLDVGNIPTSFCNGADMLSADFYTVNGNNSLTALCAFDATTAVIGRAMSTSSNTWLTNAPPTGCGLATAGAVMGWAFPTATWGGAPP